MKSRLIWLFLLMLPAASAHADYLYNVGPNYVNMAGSSCRPATLAGEGNITHGGGTTTVKSGVGTQRLFCPIPRRGTSFYQGTHGLPVPPKGSSLKVKINGAYVRGTDNSTSSPFRCFLFGARRTDQALYFGFTQAMCSNSVGCSTVAASWTGTNTLLMNTFPSALNDIETVNFGITCDVPEGSSIQYTDTGIAPN